MPIHRPTTDHTRPLVVQKLMYDGSKSYRWVGREIHRDDDHLFFTAVFERDGRDLGYVVFEKGDVFYEYYYFDRWYNVFQVYSATGTLKGWYCNVTKPAQVRRRRADVRGPGAGPLGQRRPRYLVLDEDEFAELEATAYSPEDVLAARSALTELIERAEAATIPGRPFVGPVPPPGPTGG